MPLLMHSQRGMNGLDKDAQALAILQKKRGKDSSDKLAISDMEFRLGLYWDKAAGKAYLPAFNVIRCIQDGAKALKLGTKVIQNLKMDPAHIECWLKYPGCQEMTLDALCADPSFRDVRTVVVSGTVERTRPIFRQWSLSCEFSMLAGLSLAELNQCVERAGLYYGLGDFRVGTKSGGLYGTFIGTAKVIE
jgi:hypothetical protein